MPPCVKTEEKTLVWNIKFFCTVLFPDQFDFQIHLTSEFVLCHPGKNIIFLSNKISPDTFGFQIEGIDEEPGNHLNSIQKIPLRKEDKFYTLFLVTHFKTTFSSFYS
jgi:hypothetical protein